MPTYFELDKLTPEQQAQWDGAFIEYEKIQERNMERAFSILSPAARVFYMEEGAVSDNEIKEKMRLFLGMMSGGNGNSKSALFSRLLNGKQALEFPPPCSYSYPWYSVIEDDGPWDVCQMDDVKTIDGLKSKKFNLSGKEDDETKKSERVTINQTGWDLLSVVSPTEAIITYGEWAAKGYQWRLKYESTSAVDIGQYMLSWHDPELGRITTLDQLKKEKRWHVQNNFSNLVYALDEELAANYLAEEKLKSGYQSYLAIAKVESGKTMHQSRKALGLPDYPSEDEISEQTQIAVDRCLADDYSADENGNLFISAWRLHRIA